MGKILVGMSGGVDSAVSALLLRDAGHDVTGVFMKNYEPPPHSGQPCPWEQDQADVAKTCAVLGIPWESWNFEKEYAEHVLEYFFREYQSGRTPNPDVMCNREIKFGVFLQRARREGYSAIATGHYARIVESGGQYHLLTGRDTAKDQSYFLHSLHQRELQHVHFPIGDLEKKHVRVLARNAKLPIAEKPDSQGICFVGKVDVADFLAQRVVATPGEIRATDGERLGLHRGLAFYTIGQRHGLGVGGGVPLYVVDKDVATNTLIVGRGNHDPELYHLGLRASDETWVGGMPLPGGTVCQARIRYRQESVPCTVHASQHGQREVWFEKPQRAITPGQSIVFYDGEECLGGAVITEALDR